MAVIAALIGQSLTWARGGHIPAYQPVADSAAYRALLPQANYRSEAAEVELDPAVWFAGAASDSQSAAGATIGNVLAGTETPEHALAELTATVTRLVNFVAVSDPHLMTFPVGLATGQSSYGVRYAQVMAAALLGGLPLVALFPAFQRQLVTAIKG